MPTGDAGQLLEILDQIASGAFADLRLNGVHVPDGAKFAIREGLRLCAQAGERGDGWLVPFENLVRHLHRNHGITLSDNPRICLMRRAEKAYAEGSDYQHEKDTVPAPRPPERRRKDRDP